MAYLLAGADSRQPLRVRRVRLRARRLRRLRRLRRHAAASMFEGLNNKVKLVMRRSYGFRTKRAIEIALYHNLGKLPEPHFTHEFC